MKQVMLMAAAAFAGYIAGDLKPRADKLVPKIAPEVVRTPAVQAIESAKIGPLDAFAGKFGQSTRIWLVAPKSGQTLEVTATDSEITVGTRRIGDAGSHP